MQFDRGIGVGSEETHPDHSPQDRANSKHNNGVSQAAERKHPPVKGQDGNLRTPNGERVEDSKKEEIHSCGLQ